jgi:hypothetical protein
MWDADARDRRQSRQKHQLSRRKLEALFRTRTGDPFLTIERRDGNGGQARDARAQKSRKSRESSKEE